MNITIGFPIQNIRVLEKHDLFTVTSTKMSLAPRIFYRFPKFRMFWNAMMTCQIYPYIINTHRSRRPRDVLDTHQKFWTLCVRYRPDLVEYTFCESCHVCDIMVVAQVSVFAQQLEHNIMKMANLDYWKQYKHFLGKQRILIDKIEFFIRVFSYPPENVFFGEKFNWRTRSINTADRGNEKLQNST